ncbi:MAG TPA: hypothetical protein VHZ51_15600 [Ktedonobacteraceae bacterium]|jgi:hypothetical protein|nr:hypothetical protein [Ktedonobacteraceae bacterium]
MSCGCNKPNDNHGDARNITLQDIKTRNISMHEIEDAARAANITPEEVIKHIESITPENVPHHAWGEMRDEPGPADTDYGVSQSGDERSTQTYPEKDTLVHHTDEQGDQHLMRDGYAETQGSGYGETESQQGSTHSKAQEGYDPAHSGVRHSKNRPGERVDTPGRETGTAWSERLESGETDTPDRGNPAN